MYNILKLKQQVDLSLPKVITMCLIKDLESNKKQQDSFANTIGLRNPELADES